MDSYGVRSEKSNYTVGQSFHLAHEKFKTAILYVFTNPTSIIILHDNAVKMGVRVAHVRVFSSMPVTHARDITKYAIIILLCI